MMVFLKLGLVYELGKFELIQLHFNTVCVVFGYCSSQQN